MDLDNITDIEVLKKELKKHYVTFGIRRRDSVNDIQDRT